MAQVETRETPRTKQQAANAFAATVARKRIFQPATFKLALEGYLRALCLAHPELAEEPVNIKQAFAIAYRASSPRYDRFRARNAADAARRIQTSSQ